MNRTIIPVLLATAASLFSHTCVAAPVIAQENYITSWATLTGGVGQTFVWPANARLGIARVVSDANITGTFKLYNGAHTCDDIGDEFYAQTGIALAQETYSTIVLNAPQNLINDNTYTFCVYNAATGRIALHYTSKYSYYPDGVFVSDNTIDPVGGGGDLQFELDVTPAAATVVATPTLGAGLLALLATLLLAIGLRAGKRDPDRRTW